MAASGRRHRPTIDLGQRTSSQDVRFKTASLDIDIPEYPEPPSLFTSIGSPVPSPLPEPDVFITPQQPDEHGIYPLHRAARNNDIQLVQQCLDQNADISVTVPSGHTAVHFAAAAGAVDVLRLLLSIAPHLANVSCRSHKFTPLHLAAAKGHVSAARVLLQTSKAAAFPISTTRSTPLHLAAEHGHLAVVNLLLDAAHASFVDEEDQDGETALHRAALCGHADVVARLLDAGAQPNKRSQIGYLPLLQAAKGGNADCVQTIIERAPETVTQSLPQGASAWHVAAACGHTLVLQYLLDLLRDLDEDAAVLVWSDQQYNTPVHDAAAHGQLNCLKLMYREGVLLDTENLKDETPLDIARDCENIECAVYLTMKTSA